MRSIRVVDPSKLSVTQHEPVHDIFTRDIESHDDTGLVDVNGRRSLARSATGARRIDCGKDTFLIDKAMHHAGVVLVVADNDPQAIGRECAGRGGLAGGGPMGDEHEEAVHISEAALRTCLALETTDDEP